MLHTIACASPFLMGLHGQARHHQITALDWTLTSGRTLAVLASLGDSPGAAVLGYIVAVGPLPALLGLGTHMDGRSLYRGSWPRKESQLHDICWPVAADAVASDRRVEQIGFWNVQISKMQISHSMPRHRIPHLPALDTPILPHHHQLQYHSKQTASPRLLNLAHWLFLASYRHPAGTPSHPPSISASAEEPSEPSSLRHLSPLTGRR